jgi:formamidopyrimidine-DNA glycosylase
MPELPDITIYVDALRARVVNAPLERVRVRSPFLVRTVQPPIEEAQGKAVVDVCRLGKQIVLALADDLFLVLHLMIAGRLRWLARGAQVPARGGLAAFDFATGTLVLTEVSPKKRAALHLVRGEAALRRFDAGGLEVLDADRDAFRRALRRENHTLKRAFTDPRLFSGIGNAYSDEILHAARLSPVTLTSKLTDDEIVRLHRATQVALSYWIAELRRKFVGRFPGPGEITAFRPDFAVHGRYGEPCLVCGTAVQRIRYAENETNYCPRCQTGGCILADRSLSRLLRDDWPRTIEELER